MVDTRLSKTRGCSRSPDLKVSAVFSQYHPVTRKSQQVTSPNLQQIQAAQRQAINLKVATSSESSPESLMDSRLEEQQMKLLQLDIARVTIPLQPLAKMRNSATAGASLGLVSPTVQ